MRFTWAKASLPGMVLSFNMPQQVTSNDILFCHIALCVQEFPQVFGGLSSTLTYGPSSTGLVGSPERAAPLRLHEDTSRSGHLQWVHCGRMEIDYLQISTSENTRQRWYPPEHQVLVYQAPGETLVETLMHHFTSAIYQTVHELSGSVCSKSLVYVLSGSEMTQIPWLHK